MKLLLILEPDGIRAPVDLQNQNIVHKIIKSANPKLYPGGYDNCPCGYISFVCPFHMPLLKGLVVGE